MARPSATCHPERPNCAHGLCRPCYTVQYILCQQCNVAIGALGDDPERIERAAAYVREPFTAALGREA